MENKIIEGNFIKLKKILIPTLLIILIIDLIGLVYGCNEAMRWEHETLETVLFEYPDVYLLDYIMWIFPFSAITIALWIYFFAMFRKFELVITDKRVYGKAVFGKRVDLPLDKVSAVGTSFLKGIDVGTSSGRIKFKLVKNQDEIHSALSKLLMERQEKETKSTVVENIISTSNADELKKFKDLLDSGVITQEEFDEKKKQLLGL